MSTIEQIDKAVETLGTDNLVLMHATSTYPLPPEEANLRMINTLQERYQVPVGYSGHERGLQISLAAVALGAVTVERHITLDRTMWGSDQASSLEPKGFEALIRDIRILEKPPWATASSASSRASWPRCPACAASTPSQHAPRRGGRSGRCRRPPRRRRLIPARARRRPGIASPHRTDFLPTIKDPPHAMSQTAHRISVIIPAKDQASFIRDCLASLERQLADPAALEVLVIDDGSSDGTGELAAGFRDRLPGLRIIRNDSPRGLATARNQGLEASTAPHIAYLDGDDWLAPGHLAACSRSLDELDVDFVRTDHIRVTGGTRVLHRAPQALRNVALDPRASILPAHRIHHGRLPLRLGRHVPAPGGRARPAALPRRPAHGRGPGLDLAAAPGMRLLRRHQRPGDPLPARDRHLADADLRQAASSTSSRRSGSPSGSCATSPTPRSTGPR